jgi:hypothetical protein
VQIEVPRFYAGPPTMGHGGYVAGLFTTRIAGAVQVTLRRPTPLDAPLELVGLGDSRYELRAGDDVIAEAEPATLEIDIPSPPSLDAARAAESGSPAHYDGRGVHPTCFGCGQEREEGRGLAIAVGPVEGDASRQVAAVWRPDASLAAADNVVGRAWVLAALDCPGAFAFIANGSRAGLLGRIVFDQHGDVLVGKDHIVTGWEIGVDGRKLFAGTALFDADGSLLAAARATWFQMQPR